MMICLSLLRDAWCSRVICLRSGYSQIDPVFILILPLTSCANLVKSLPSLCLLPRLGSGGFNTYCFPSSKAELMVHIRPGMTMWETEETLLP